LKTIIPTGLAMKTTRRKFLKSTGTGSALLFLDKLSGFGHQSQSANPLLTAWRNPPREFSQAPFWFWNDALSEKEIARQMQDFCDHGVYGVVIHPRAGLPRDIGWMSERMIHYLRFAIEEAARKNMWIVLYDEGMYPSGSSSGQVVAQNPAFRPRGLFAIDLEESKPGQEKFGFRIGDDGMPTLDRGQNLLAVVKRRKNGHRIAIMDRFIRPGYSLIRGLHFLEDNPARRPNKREVAENMPPLADILNPEAMACFIRLVYQRFYDEFGMHFGKTIKAVFTDEPSFFGKRAERGAIPGNTEVLKHVNRWLNYDFTPHLPALWFRDEPDASQHRQAYDRALQARLEETYYRPISQWCQAHNIELTGHPAAPDDIGQLRYFQIPGQDIVWRYIEPGKANALEGAQSTQAKCASSAMIHLGRRRNSNEYCGAYGHNFTFREMKWLANWLLVRGCNLLYPHAFYYSVRGPRIDERPPDVGPNNVWWGDFHTFAQATSRLCWLNTDSQHHCEIALLGLNDRLPWRAAKCCFQRQLDFNYLEARHLWEDAEITEEGIMLAGMHYKALILSVAPPAQAQAALNKLDQAGRLINWGEHDSEDDLLSALNQLVSKDVRISPANRDIRARHVIKGGVHFYILFNEGEKDATVRIQLGVTGRRILMNAATGETKAVANDAPLALAAHQVEIIAVDDTLRWDS
jgi:hypothetical protein